MNERHTPNKILERLNRERQLVKYAELFESSTPGFSLVVDVIDGTPVFSTFALTHYLQNVGDSSKNKKSFKKRLEQPTEHPFLSEGVFTVLGALIARYSILGIGQVYENQANKAWEYINDGNNKKVRLYKFYNRLQPPAVKCRDEKIYQNNQ